MSATEPVWKLVEALRSHIAKIETENKEACRERLVVAETAFELGRAAGVQQERNRDELPIQDPAYPIGIANPGLPMLRERLHGLVGEWREVVNQIGPDIAGAAFEQCANQLAAALRTPPGDTT